jgi:hypothetical protein
MAKDKASSKTFGKYNTICPLRKARSPAGNRYIGCGRCFPGHDKDIKGTSSVDEESERRPEEKPQPRSGSKPKASDTKKKK